MLVPCFLRGVVFRGGGGGAANNNSICSVNSNWSWCGSRGCAGHRVLLLSRPLECARNTTGVHGLRTGTTGLTKQQTLLNLLPWRNVVDPTCGGLRDQFLLPVQGQVLERTVVGIIALLFICCQRRGFAVVVLGLLFLGGACFYRLLLSCRFCCNIVDRKCCCNPGRGFCCFCFWFHNYWVRQEFYTRIQQQLTKNL